MLASHPHVLDAVGALSQTLKGEGRVLLRPSGTEPLLRVMVEGQDDQLVQMQAQQLHDEIRGIEQKISIGSIKIVC